MVAYLVLTKGQIIRVQTAEMKQLRKAKGITRGHRIRNKIVRKELDIQTVTTNIEEQRLGWFGYLLRMAGKTGMESQSSAKKKDRKTKRNLGHSDQQDLKKEGKDIYIGEKHSRNQKRVAKIHKGELQVILHSCTLGGRKGYDYIIYMVFQ